MTSGLAFGTGCPTLIDSLAHLTICGIVAGEDDVMEIISFEGDHGASNVRNTFIGDYHEMPHCGAVKKIKISLIKIKIS